MQKEIKIRVKEQIITPDECKNLASFFLEQSKVKKCKNLACGTRGTGPNRLRILTVDLQNRRTEWFPYVEEYQKRLADAFDIQNWSDSYSWISIMVPIVDLPSHVDPPTKDRIRIIAILQKPEVGGEIFLSHKEFSEKTILPLQVGDAYDLPAHKFYHGISMIEQNQVPRIVMGFDYNLVD